MKHEAISCTTHRTYYMSCEEYEELWAFAQGRCQICQSAPDETPRGKLCIDHLGPYGWGMVRGLLCDKCNSLMARVDAGSIRYPDGAVRRYQRTSWFARHVMFGRGFSVDRVRCRPRWKWPEDQMPEGKTA